MFVWGLVATIGVVLTEVGFELLALLGTALPGVAECG